MNISGSGRIPAGEYSEKISVSGSGKIDGKVRCKALSCSGSVSGNGEVQCLEDVHVAGSLNCEEGIEAENVKISGAIHCAGLLNAENIEIEFGQPGCSIASIGGSNITILSSDSKNTLNRLALFLKLVKNAGTFQIQQAIEGDVIAVEKVTSPLIVGRIVAIGAGCQIDLVQYSEEIEVHPDAIVGKLEKI